MEGGIADGFRHLERVGFTLDYAGAGDKEELIAANLDIADSKSQILTADDTDELIFRDYRGICRQPCLCSVGACALELVGSLQGSLTRPVVMSVME